MSVFSDIMQWVSNLTPVGQANQAGTGITATVQSIPGLAGFLGAVGDLTDGKMWRSLGWLILGVLLIFAGLFLWLRGTIIPKISVGGSSGTGSNGAAQ